MKLFLLLSSLSKEELKVLRKAVLSPLYNSNKKVVQLFELLRPKHPTFDASQKVKEDLLTLLEKISIKNAAYHREKIDLFTAKLFHHTHDKYDFQDNTLEQAMEALDIYFVLQKLRLGIAFKGRQQVLNKNSPILFLEAIKKERVKGFQQDNVLLKLYLQAMDFSEKTSLANFKQYEQSFFTQLKEFDKFDQKVLFMAGINLVIKKKNHGISTFNSFPFKWYRFGLSNDLILKQKKLDESDFANIIINGCHEKEFDWVESFIGNYKKYLNIGDVEDRLLYYRGVVYYLKGDWDKSLDYLINGTNKDIYPLRSRSVIVRAFFEKFLMDNSYLEILLSNIQAFEIYLRRNPFFVEEKVNHYLNFLLIAKLLARKIHANESSQSIKDWFQDKTNSYKSILAKSWLIEKVNKL